MKPKFRLEEDEEDLNRRMASMGNYDQEVPYWGKRASQYLNSRRPSANRISHQHSAHLPDEDAWSHKLSGNSYTTDMGDFSEDYVRWRRNQALDQLGGGPKQATPPPSHRDDFRDRAPSGWMTDEPSPAPMPRRMSHGGHPPPSRGPAYARDPPRYYDRHNDFDYHRAPPDPYRDLDYRDRDRDRDPYRHEPYDRHDPYDPYEKRYAPEPRGYASDYYDDYDRRPPPDRRGDPYGPPDDRRYYMDDYYGGRDRAPPRDNFTRGPAPRRDFMPQRRDDVRRPPRSQPKQPKEPKEKGQATDRTPPDKRTTVMLRNMPEGYARDNLTDLLDVQGFASVYDFVYMPMNFRTKSSFGYAFVNLISPSTAERCHEKFNGFKEWGIETDKVCEVSWSNMHQGLEAHIERYRSSPVMHESIQDDYKPVVFQNGSRVTFPPPTKKISQPRIRKPVQDAAPEGEGDKAEDFDGESDTEAPQATGGDKDAAAGPTFDAGKSIPQGVEKHA